MKDPHRTHTDRHAHNQRLAFLAQKEQARARRNHARTVADFFLDATEPTNHERPDQSNDMSRPTDGEA